MTKPLLERIKRLLPKTLSDTRGSSFVELALILPIFATILLGSAEFGRLAYDSIEVTNAAYAGAVYGAQSGSTASDTANMQAAASADAANLSEMTATATKICSCSDGTAITCSTPSSCVSPARIQEFVQVNTAATVTLLIRAPGLPATYTLHGQSVLRVVQ